MVLLDGKKFSKIIRRYRCDDKMLQQVREYILNQYCLSEQLKIGRCLVTISDNSDLSLISGFEAGEVPVKQRNTIDVKLTY